MRKIGILLITALLFAACKPKFAVHPTFYFWRTVYTNQKAETKYLNDFKSKSLYVRIMDVDINPDTQEPVPVSPVSFEDSLPKQTTIVPVVYLVNNIFNNLSEGDSKLLATRISKFVNSKVNQAGKKTFSELQIDCDWTKTTRDKYFIFLNQLKLTPLLKRKQISVTLRLHQVKNLASSGIPPVTKVMLMCYNMGNLRKYGEQNSILDMKEMETYLSDKLETYPLKIDVALPLFNWAVVFRKEKYAGISKRISKAQINDKKLFKRRGKSTFFDLMIDYPQAGLRTGDVIRWEEVTPDDLLTASRFLSRHLKPEERNVVFYHLDNDLLNTFKHDELQKVIDNF
ncbi:hypothetical protein [Pedobacter sp. Leaf194]|uniref:hypothetical protein n=1 Tax=Pedobacter sp. Leaf194 TaxID=1736297 RepID=UPI000703347C|nr:hypothetical protein [Pedobacter sp. Leaf194]KQS35371.1 hypothetical protein ASG14_14415 [Pedobacter sp. Leaf194]